MIPIEQASYNYAEFLIRNSLSAPEVLTGYTMDGQCWYGDGSLSASGFSNIQTMQICNNAQSTMADASAVIPIGVAPSGIRSLIDLLEVKNYAGLIKMAGLTLPTECGSSENERQDTHLLQTGNINSAHDSDSSKGKTAASGLSPRKSVSKTRRRRNEVEHNRRAIMNEKLQALQELLPSSSKGNRDAVVENAMRYIEHLQLQLKELTSKLGGESSSTPLIYVEGHGHYYPQDQMFGESLEDVLGSLIEENPTEAWKLLEGKGLHMMPIAALDALRQVE